MIHQQNFDSRKKMTFMDPLKNIFDPRNSHKNYDSCEKYSEQRNPRKNLTHTTHAATELADPRNPHYQTTHVI